MNNTSNNMSTTPTHDRQFCDSFNHCFWPFIFSPCDLVRHFQASLVSPSFSKSVNFRPCYLVRHFPGPSFSGLAIWSVIFLSCYFRSCIFSTPPSPCISPLPRRGGPGVSPRKIFENRYSILCILVHFAAVNCDPLDAPASHL